MIKAGPKGELMPPGRPKHPSTVGNPVPGKAKPETPKPSSVAAEQAPRPDKDAQAKGRTKVKNYTPPELREAERLLLGAKERFAAALEAYQKWVQLLSATERKRELITLEGELLGLKAEPDLSSEEGGSRHFGIAWCKARIAYLRSLPGNH